MKLLNIKKTTAFLVILSVLSPLSFAGGGEHPPCFKYDGEVYCAPTESEEANTDRSIIISPFQIPNTYKGKGKQDIPCGVPAKLLPLYLWFRLQNLHIPPLP